MSSTRHPNFSYSFRKPKAGNSSEKIQTTRWKTYKAVVGACHPLSSLQLFSGLSCSLLERGIHLESFSSCLKQKKENVSEKLPKWRHHHASYLRPKKIITPRSIPRKCLHCKLTFLILIYIDNNETAILKLVHFFCCRVTSSIEFSLNKMFLSRMRQKLILIRVHYELSTFPNMWYYCESIFCWRNERSATTLNFLMRASNSKGHRVNNFSEHSYETFIRQSIVV